MHTEIPNETPEQRAARYQHWRELGFKWPEPPVYPLTMPRHQRRWRLLAKLAFPQIDTHRTRFMFVPRVRAREYCLPIYPPRELFFTEWSIDEIAKPAFQIARLSPRKWVARQRSGVFVVLWLDYNAEADTCIIAV